MDYDETSQKIANLFEELHARVIAFIGENSVPSSDDSLDITLQKTVDSRGFIYYTFTLKGSVFPIKKEQ